MTTIEPRQSPRVPAVDQRLARLRRLAWWLDEGVRVPGTSIRIGLDPILGLVPGLGDAAGALLGVSILVEAVRRGVPRATVIRVVGNIILDTVIGAVPVIGDVFDWVWKSNRRNLQLLERHSIEPLKSRRKDRLLVVSLLALLVVICVGLLFAFAMLGAAVVRVLTGL